MGLEALAITSAVLSVGSGFMQYREQKKADKANQAAYAESLNIANEQAKLDREDAARAATEARLEAEQHQKKQRALFLKSGVSLEGSPLLVMEETRAKGEENAKNIVENAAARSRLNVQSVAANKPVSRASLTNTALDVGGELAGTYTNYEILKRQLK